MNNFYSKKIMEHFLNPKYIGHLENADGVGNTENLKCGDVMKIYIKVADKTGQKYIEDIKFETLGCGTAIAASDIICQIALGKTLEQAKQIKFSDVIKELGEIPQPKIHCSSLAERALKEAIADYEGKQ